MCETGSSLQRPHVALTTPRSRGSYIASVARVRGMHGLFCTGFTLAVCLPKMIKMKRSLQGRFYIVILLVLIISTDDVETCFSIYPFSYSTTFADPPLTCLFGL